jgi:hypothetical protein
MRLIPAIELEAFSITTTDEGGAVIVKLSGNGDSAAVQPLDEYLVRLHAALLARKAGAVRVDFTQVFFMNSACIKAFASWIHDVKTCSSPYPVTLCLNPGLSWQKRTLKTIARLAPDSVVVEEAPR